MWVAATMTFENPMLEAIYLMVYAFVTLYAVKVWVDWGCGGRE